MLLYPELEQDESLYSLTSRIHRFSGFSNPHSSSELLYGNPRALCHHDIQSGIGELARRTEGRYGSSRQIIESTTVLPFFTRFHSSERRNLIYAMAEGQNWTALKFALGLPASRTGGFLPLGCCEDCLRHDRERAGIAYWRRAHQLPGVFVCAEHGQPLLFSPRLEGWRRLRVACLPSDGQVPLAAVVRALRPPAGNRLLALAQTANALLLHDAPRFFSPDTVRHAYRQGLRDRGLLTKRGDVRIRLYLDAVLAHFAPVKDLAVFQPFFKGSWLRGFLKPLRSGSHEPSSLMHVLMIDFLWGEWAGFAKAYEWQSALSSEEDRSQRDIGRRRTDASMDTRRESVRLRIEEMLKRGADKKSLTEALGWDYSWMRIYDAQWLRETLPSHRDGTRRGGSFRVDWALRDAELERRIEQGAGHLSFTGREKIKPQRIVDKLGGTSFSVRWDRLPRARKSVEKAVANHLRNLVSSHQIS